MRLVRVDGAPFVRLDLDAILLDEVVVSSCDGGHSGLAALVEVWTDGESTCELAWEGATDESTYLLEQVRVHHTDSTET